MSLCLGKSKPFLLINAQGLAAEIRRAGRTAIHQGHNRSPDDGAS